MNVSDKTQMDSASTAARLPHGGHAHRVSDRVAVPRERGERGVNS